MNGAEIAQHFRVLFLEERETRGLLFQKWLDGVPTAVETTEEDLLRNFDSSVAVVVLSQSLLDDREEEIRRYLINRNPSCQLVLVESRSPSSVRYKQHYDATLTRPVSKRELRRTVEQQLKYGIYGALLEEYYSLSATLVSLGRGGPSETSVDRERVEEQLQNVKAPLERLRSVIDHDDVKELHRSLKIRKKNLTEPARDVDTSSTSKHHPDSCPQCELPWGEDHGNALGVGFSQVGAYVWKCTRCGSILHGSEGNDRHIAKL